MDNTELAHYGVKGMKWGVRRTLEQLGHTTSTVSGLHLSSKTMSATDIYSRVVNPINPTGDGKNCAYCALAFEMRRRGYDVTAKSNDGSSWSLNDYITKTNAYSSNLTDEQKNTLSATPVVYNSSTVEAIIAYGFEDEYNELVELQESGKLSKEEFNAKVREFYAKVRDKSIEKVGNEIFNALSKEPDRSRGMITMMVAGHSGGHVMSYEIIDNKPVIYDSQNKKMYTSSDNVCEYFSSMENNFIVNAGYTRLDNVNLNMESISDWVDNMKHASSYSGTLDELMHHGVKGMKWGVRKDRPSSGSSTARKKKTTAKSAIVKKKKSTKTEPSAARKAVNAMVEKRKAKKAQKAAEEAAKKQKRKPVSEMTDEELNAAIKRLQLEKQYKELTAYHNPNQGKGKKFVNTVLEKSGEQLATQVVNHYGAKALNAAIGDEVIFANNKKK